jgi:hypothetical protein
MLLPESSVSYETKGSDLTGRYTDSETAFLSAPPHCSRLAPELRLLKFCQ